MEPARSLKNVELEDIRRRLSYMGDDPETIEDKIREAERAETLYNEAFRLRHGENGLSIGKISKRLNVSYGTVWGWLYGGAKPAGLKGVTPTFNIPQGKSAEFAYVLGVYAAVAQCGKDCGYFKSKKSGGFLVHSKTEAHLHPLKESLESILNSKADIKEEQRKGGNYRFLRFPYELRRYLSFMSDKNQNVIWEHLFSDEEKISFINGFLDYRGEFREKPAPFVLIEKQNGYSLIEDIGLLFSSLGIIPSIHYKTMLCILDSGDIHKLVKYRPADARAQKLGDITPAPTPEQDAIGVFSRFQELHGANGKMPLYRIAKLLDVNYSTIANWNKGALPHRVRNYRRLLEIRKSRGDVDVIGFVYRNIKQDSEFARDVALRRSHNEVLNSYNQILRDAEPRAHPELIYLGGEKLKKAITQLKRQKAVAKIEAVQEDKVDKTEARRYEGGADETQGRLKLIREAHQKYLLNKASRELPQVSLGPPLKSDEILAYAKVIAGDGLRVSSNGGDRLNEVINTYIRSNDYFTPNEAYLFVSELLCIRTRNGSHKDIKTGMKSLEAVMNRKEFDSYFYRNGNGVYYEKLAKGEILSKLSGLLSNSDNGSKIYGINNPNSDYTFAEGGIELFADDESDGASLLGAADGKDKLADANVRQEDRGNRKLYWAAIREKDEGPPGNNEFYATPGEEAKGINKLLGHLLMYAVRELDGDNLTKREDAREWFESTDEKFLFSFLNICDYLDLNPDYVKKQIYSPSRGNLRFVD